MKLFDRQPDPARVLEERRNTLSIAIRNLHTLLQHPALTNHPKYQEAQSLLRHAEMVVSPPDQGGSASADVLEEVRRNLNKIDRELESALPDEKVGVEPVGSDPTLPTGIWHTIMQHFRHM